MLQWFMSLETWLLMVSFDAEIVLGRSAWRKSISLSCRWDRPGSGSLLGRLARRCLVPDRAET